jgi:hypothetical protein
LIRSEAEAALRRGFLVRGIRLTSGKMKENKRWQTDLPISS